ncbi:outer membrane beta-barrel protein [Alteromonas gilva]|uniref:Outer membrane beta-barrel protein n=1 Tax=Alteromonas gilva TaxID=2987522 RepID=A0ABT5KYR8_9ALTE|nr:outer membrane beta-barrel protein [Alteromonas gilva]MDC8829329.1 outer membrane beta-barrel protein [Alteromonas gilva]
MKNTVFLTSAALAFLFVPVPGTAATPDWRYLEGGYLSYDGDGGFDPDGLQINGKYSLDKHFYLNGEYGWAESRSADFTTLTLGGGYRLRLNPTTDVYVGANFERIDSDYYDNNGYSLVGGVRSFITPDIEVNGELGYLDIDEGDMTFKAGAYYYLNPQLAVGANYELMDDADVFQLSGRYVF